MRQEHERLGHFFEPFLADFVKENGDDDLQHVPQQDKSQIVHDRIKSQPPQVPGHHEKFEIVEADERTAENAVRVVVFNERKIQARHWQISEHDEKQDGRQTHQQQRSIVAETSPAAAAMKRLAAMPPGLRLRLRNGCHLRRLLSYRYKIERLQLSVSLRINGLKKDG